MNERTQSDLMRTALRALVLAGLALALLLGIQWYMRKDTAETSEKVRQQLEEIRRQEGGSR